MTDNTTFSARNIKVELENYVSNSGDRYISDRTPTLFKLWEAARDGKLFVGSPEDQDPPINVTVVGLTEQITAKRDAIAAVYDEALAELDKEDARRGNFAAALAEYFAVIGAAHTSGDFNFDPSTGRLSQKDGGAKLPVQPTKPRTEGDVAAARTRALGEKAAALAPFEAQLTTLSIASDEAIPVQATRFTTLLQTVIPTDLRY